MYIVSYDYSVGINSSAHVVMCLTTYTVLSVDLSPL